MRQKVEPQHRGRHEKMQMSIFSRWTLRICLLVVLLGLISWAWSYLRDPWRFPVESVRVEGTYQHLNNAELRQSIMPYVTKGFFAVPVTDLRESLLNMPWVADASVRRVWPSTVVIDLTEETAIAHWGKDSLLNPEGNVFSPIDAAEITGLPVFDGPGGQQQTVLKTYATMDEVLASVDLQIQELIMSPRHAWQMTLNNGMQLMLGKEDVLARLQRFVDVYPELQETPNKQVAYADLRYTNGMALRWQAKEDK